MVKQVTCLSRLRRIAYGFIVSAVSAVAIFPGVGVCLTARDKWNVAHKLDEERLLVQKDRDVVYAEAKNPPNPKKSRQHSGRSTSPLPTSSRTVWTSPSARGAFGVARRRAADAPGLDGAVAEGASGCTHING